MQLLQRNILCMHMCIYYDAEFACMIASLHADTFQEFQSHTLGCYVPHYGIHTCNPIVRKINEDINKAYTVFIVNIQIFRNLLIKNNVNWPLGPPKEASVKKKA